MPNQYVNKVVRSDGATLMDISDTTAVASDVASGKYFYLATGAKVAGTKTEKELDTKSITLNGTYSAEDDSVDGYSEVTVNVQNGAAMTEVANAYGTGVVITSAQGAAPSATRHTLYFEYEDETTETVYAYYDDALIGPAITATTPTTHNSKAVTSAQLDGVEWYSYTPDPGPTPGGDWTTVYDDTITTWGGESNIDSLAGGAFAANETYRITLDGTQYVCTTEFLSAYSIYYIGNIALATGGDDGTGIPVLCYHQPQALKVIIRNGGDGVNHTFKLEKQVSA